MKGVIKENPNFLPDCPLVGVSVGAHRTNNGIIYREHYLNRACCARKIDVLHDSSEGCWFSVLDNSNVLGAKQQFLSVEDDDI